MNRLAESLLWFSRRAIVDPLILDLMIAWEQRFRRQGRYFLRKGVPKLQAGEFFEAAVFVPLRQIDAFGEPIELVDVNGQPIEFFEAAARTPDVRALDAIAAAVNTLDEFQDTFAGRTFTRVVALALVGGAQQVQRETGSLTMAFGLKSPVVFDFLKARSAEQLGRDVDATTKERVRALLVKGYRESWGIGRMRREIRELFDGFATKAVQGNFSSRADLIATTEIGNAFSHGALAQAEEMEDGGIEMEKAWALAANACPLCAANAAQGWIPISRQFASGADRPLQHPACRCSLLVRAKPLA